MLRMLLGLFKSATTTRKFNVAFDWFYEHLDVMKSCMDVFDGDDEVIHLVMKLMQELSDNKDKRLSVWSENGLIIYKQVSNILIAFMDKHDKLGFSSQLVASDQYKSLFKYIRRLVAIVSNLVEGSYVNIAACQFYND